MMSRLKFVALLVIAASTLGLAADEAKPKLGSVQGSVTDAVKGLPLANAGVTLYPIRTYAPQGTVEAPSLRATTSDPDGRFALTNVDPGDYFLTVSKLGYLDQTYGSRIGWKNGIPISVASGDLVKDVTVSLLPGAVISGVVENEDGEGLANASVRALQYRYKWPGKKLTLVSSTTTNDRGEYRLHGLMPGSYYIACSTPRSRVIKENDTAFVGRYPVTFYPSVTTIETAVPTLVKAGDESIAKLSLTASKAYTIRGKVAGGDPDAKLVLAIRPTLSTGDATQTLATADDGSFEINGVLPGDYLLIAMGKSRGQMGSGKRKITVEDRDLNDLLITLENQRPVINGRIFANGDRSGLKAVLVPGTSEDDGDDDTSVMAFAPNVPKGTPVTDRYGEFTAAELARDAKTVFATVQPTTAGFEDFYVARVTFNGEDVTNSGFSPSRGGSLLIEFLNNGGRIEGTIAAADGHTLPGATVVLVPDESRRGRRDLHHILRADQNGAFAIRGLAPGKYTALAFETAIDTDAIYDAAFISPFIAMAKAQTIDVTRRGKSNVVLGAISETTDVGAQ